MKRLFIISIVLLIGSWCFGQEIELNGSLNTSSEKRFQSAIGIGVQYQHDLGQSCKFGLGMQYISNNSKFDQIKYIDADPITPFIEKFNSTSHRLSFRFNIQGLLLNRENYSISLGPEISYNILWGKDQIERIIVPTLKWDKFSENIGAGALGLGLISKVEVKNFISPQYSICFNIRPEFTTSGIIAKGYNPVFSGVIGFMEFQIGLKYRFKK